MALREQLLPVNIGRSKAEAWRLNHRLAMSTNIASGWKSSVASMASRPFVVVLT
jgi:hypothetical protein